VLAADGDGGPVGSVADGGGRGEIVVKALSGPGRGSQVLAGTAGTLPARAPFPGPYLVEARLPADDTDRKLYLAGGAVRGLLKPSTLTHPHVTSGTPFTPEAELVDLALEVGRVLDAPLLGVDLLRTPDGPVIVDVDGFPGFHGIDDAPALVTAHLREHARAG
jgi:ribosomal protein S6--L-glutamate ligase